MSVLLQIVVMAGVTYLVRVIPFTLFRRQIRSPFFRSFLYYIPYAVLSAMTIPAIFSATSDPLASMAGALAAVWLAYHKKSLIVVAVAAAAAALLTGLLL